MEANEVPDTFKQDWILAKKAKKLREEGQFTSAIEIFTQLFKKYKVSELFLSEAPHIPS